MQSIDHGLTHLNRNIVKMHTSKTRVLPGKGPQHPRYFQPWCTACNSKRKNAAAAGTTTTTATAAAAATIAVDAAAPCRAQWRAQLSSNVETRGRSTNGRQRVHMLVQHRAAKNGRLLGC